MNNLDTPSEKSVARKFAKVIIVIVTIILAVVVVVIGSQQPDSSTRDGFIEFVIATEQLSTGKDIVVSIDNVTLYVPGNEITQAGSISLLMRRSILSDDASELIWYRPFVVSIEYRNEDGLFYPQVKFSSPVEICFRLPPRYWKDYIDHPDKYQVQYLIAEEVPPRWEALPIVSYDERNELCGVTDHFPAFSLAINISEAGDPLVMEILESGDPFTDETPTPEPATVLDFLFNFFRENPDESSVGSGDVDEPSRRPDDVYEP